LFQVLPEVRRARLGDHRLLVHVAESSDHFPDGLIIAVALFKRRGGDDSYDDLVDITTEVSQALQKLSSPKGQKVPQQAVSPEEE